MERKDFLKGMGVLGLGAIIPASKAETVADTLSGNSSSCVLIPTETAGPFPLDLSANTNCFCDGIRATKTGTQLNVKMKILGLTNCEPMPKLCATTWHCAKDGLYSGYSRASLRHIHRSFIVPRGRAVAVKNKSGYAGGLQLTAGTNLSRL